MEMQTLVTVIIGTAFLILGILIVANILF